MSNKILAISIERVPYPQTFSPVIVDGVLDPSKSLRIVRVNGIHLQLNSAYSNKFVKDCSPWIWKSLIVLFFCVHHFDHYSTTPSSLESTLNLRFIKRSEQEKRKFTQVDENTTLITQSLNKNDLSASSRLPIFHFISMAAIFSTFHLKSPLHSDGSSDPLRLVSSLTYAQYP
jgi:hypothetical protein